VLSKIEIQRAADSGSGGPVCSVVGMKSEVKEIRSLASDFWLVRNPEWEHQQVKIQTENTEIRVHGEHGGEGIEKTGIGHWRNFSQHSRVEKLAF
jgi:hypothetical protein